MLLLLALTGVVGLGKRLKRSGESFRTTMALEVPVRPARPLVVELDAAMVVYLLVVKVVYSSVVV